jgi:hypothetical protein
MARRPLRPSFALSDKNRLIEALGATRHLVGLCSAAERYGSDLHVLCHAISDSIDGLAEGLTGNRNLFVANPPVALPATPELDEAATAVFNALHASSGYQPVDGIDDLEAEGMAYAVRDWRTIRHAIEKMPPTVIEFLVNRQQRKSAHG